MKHYLSNKICIILVSLILIVALFFMLFNVNSRPAERWDEYTNIVVVNNMIKSGNYLDFSFDNKPFLEKPPFWYWGTSAIVKLFGHSLTNYRIVSVFSGFLTIFFTMYIAWKKFSPKISIVSGVILITTRQLFFTLSGYFSVHNFASADLDALQILFMTMTFLTFLEFDKNKSFRVNFTAVAAAGVFSGLAFLTKGPFAVLPPLLFFSYQISFLKKKTLFKYVVIFIGVFLILVLPWHIYETIIHGKVFIDKYFLYHQLERGFTKLEGHNEGFFYYLKLIINPKIVLTGILLFPSLLLVLIKKSQQIALKFEYFYIVFFPLLYWTLINLMGTKLSWYLLPIYPVSAILISLGINEVLIKIKTLNKPIS